jgi:hypothetical protein
MLIRYDHLRKCKILAADGDIGHIDDVYFDDNAWVVRYLVVDTGGWLSGRSVLLAPHVVLGVDLEEKRVHTPLNREQVKHSPEAEAAKPLSRQYEEALHVYYGWPYYWAGPSFAAQRDFGAHPESLIGGVSSSIGPATVGAPAPMQPPSEPPVMTGDPHLRNAEEIIQYAIAAKDGDLGHVDTLVMDDREWAVRYLLVKTGTWLSGREILLSCSWIHDLSWTESRVKVNLDRETIRTSPEIDTSRPITREDEERLFQHYGHKGYWHSE